MISLFIVKSIIINSEVLFQNVREINVVHVKLP